MRPAPLMGSDVRPRLVGGIAVLAVSAALVAAVLYVLTPPVERAATGIPRQLGGLAVDLAWVGVGQLIVRRRPANVIGWLVIAFGLVGIAGALAESEAYYTGRRHLRDPSVLIELSALLVALPLRAATFLGLLLLFPTGKLPSRRWRGLAALVIILVVLTATFVGLVLVLAAARPDLGPRLREALDGFPTNEIIAPLTVTSIFGTFASVVWRWWRARERERAQMRWLASAVVVVVLTLVVTVTLESNHLLTSDSSIALARIGGQIALSLIPLAIGAAILRDRLYDIDVIINRTIAYGVVGVLLVGLFSAVAALMSATVANFVPADPTLTNVLVLGGVLLSFRPVERRVRPIVDNLLPPREELVLVFGDLVGSTETLARVGDERWRHVLDGFHLALREEVRRHRGRLVDTSGDGFFATFTDAPAAAAFVVSLKRRLRELDLHLRVGIHSGACEMRGADPSGLNVHLTARVMASAGADEVLASEPVRAALEPRSASTHRGEFVLKGIPGKVELFALELN